jgi:hypothetical protein
MAWLTRATPRSDDMALTAGSGARSTYQTPWAYDIVLLPPFLAQFATIDDAHRTSLTVYTAVLIYPAVLSFYYLFVHRPTRLWRAESKDYMPFPR